MASRLEERLRALDLLRTGRLRDRSNPLEDMTEHQFKARFRLNKSTTIFVLNLIIGQISSEQHGSRGVYVPPILQFLAVMRFYATGTFQIVVGDLHVVSQGTVSSWTKKISNSLASHAASFIKYPTHEEASRLRQEFYELAQFPGVVGAIDCTHVKIDSPGGENAELFRNRKGVFSINVQGICTAKLIFTNLVARWYGSAHDSRIFEYSRISTDISSGRLHSLLLGDSGYACTVHVITPFENPTTPAEIRFNSAQIRARNPIERSFGVLKKRFACLKHLRLKLKTVLSVSVCTVILHTIARRQGDVYADDDYDEDDHSVPSLTSSS